MRACAIKSAHSFKWAQGRHNQNSWSVQTVPTQIWEILGKFAQIWASDSPKKACFMNIWVSFAPLYRRIFVFFLGQMYRIDVLFETSSNRR